MTGISVAGLGLVGKGGVTGVSFSGLGLVAGEGSVTGASLAGLGLVAGDAVTGISATLGMVRAKNNITGVTFAGYRMKAPEITGLDVCDRVDRCQHPERGELCGRLPPDSRTAEGPGHWRLQ